MLNLSDNELDRLSREAASQHEPGDLLGPQSWERLELRLDKELGRAGPDTSSGGRALRGIRRLPFQYAPVILLIVGVSYYFVKQASRRKAEQSGSPPLTVVKTPAQQPGATSASDPSSNNPAYSDKSTSTPYHQDQSQNTDLAAGGSKAGTTPSTTEPVGQSTSRTGNIPSSTDPSANRSSGNIPSSGSPSGNTPPAGTPTIAGPGSQLSIAPGRKTTAGLNGKTAPANTGLNRSAHSNTDLATNNRNLSGNTLSRSGTHNKRSGNNPAGSNRHRYHGNNLSARNKVTGSNAIAGNANGSDLSGNTGTTPSERSAEYTFIQKPHSLRNHPRISDSALRAYTAPTPTNPGKKSGPSLRINRPLTIGIQVAPDFSSVNSLAGDKPGSSIGLTLDYQFLDRWYIGTGLLFSKKNYTARGTDYKVPHMYYQSVGLKGVDFVKGTMTMLEIPLNIRYDFSITGNTIFFASGGISTYLFGNERCSYYYDFFGREVGRTFKYPNDQNIFSAANLSLGVETGINNNFSILLAPYMKLPLSDIGFGRIRMSSVGINVGLRYSPVLSRKRQH